MAGTVAISINASWNILNFRRGLIAALRAEGYRVVALSPLDAYSPGLAKIGVEHAPIAIDSLGVSPVRDLRLLYQYHRLLKRIRPDVFLGYTAKPNIYGSIAAHVLGIPVINNISGLGTAFIDPGLLTRIVSGLYRVALSRSHAVFFQNEDDRELFIRSRLVRPDQARLLPGSGVDLARFRPGSAPRAANAPFTFLLVGRLLWQKGIREYVEAARLVRARSPGVRFQLLGFLDVPNRSAVRREEVDAWVAEGLIDYLGHTDDVRPHIDAADCIVLPSYREGLPRTLLEGAAMGKPLIATDVPGCRHVVEQGVNGLLCKVADAGSLAQVMIEMIGMPPEQRQSMGMAGRRKVELDFAESRAVAPYLEAIGEALRPASRR